MDTVTDAWKRFRPFFISYHLLFGLFFAIVIGIAAPPAGKWVGRWPIDIPNLCVVFIFILSGITLKTSELHNAVKYPKALIIGLVLILFVTPLLGFAYMGLSGHMEYEEFVIGLATFAVVPTTISSAVVIVGLVNGNSGLSLVLSVSTNIIGVITVPFILTLVIGAGEGMKPWDLLFKLCLTILVPVIVGKLASFWPPVAAFAKRFALAIKLWSSFFLILIPWIKISQADKSIAKVSFGSVVALFLLAILMHIVFLLFNFAVCVLAKLPLPDLKAVAITSSQKTLGTGVAIVAALPASMGVQGLIVLPFIFAHFAQIAMDGLMVPWWNRRPNTEHLRVFMLAPVLIPPDDGSQGGSGAAVTDAASSTPARDGQTLVGSADQTVVDDSSILPSISGADSTPLPTHHVAPSPIIQDDGPINCILDVAQPRDAQVAAVGLATPRVFTPGSDSSFTDAARVLGTIMDPNQSGDSVDIAPTPAPYSRTPLATIMSNLRSPLVPWSRFGSGHKYRRLFSAAHGDVENTTPADVRVVHPQAAWV